MLASLNQPQLKKISSFFVDLAKILFGSAIVGFFIPETSSVVSLSNLAIGSLVAFGFLIIGISLLKNL